MNTNTSEQIFEKCAIKDSQNSTALKLVQSTILAKS